jgi:hypothetical protein
LALGELEEVESGDGPLDASRPDEKKTGRRTFPAPSALTERSAFHDADLDDTASSITTCLALRMSAAELSWR